MWPVWDVKCEQMLAAAARPAAQSAQSVHTAHGGGADCQSLTRSPQLAART